jgi:predicted membrane-bound spermidine synthase
VLNKDAFVWAKNTKKQYDVVVVDFPDPSNYSLESCILGVLQYPQTNFNS